MRSPHTILICTILAFLISIPSLLRLPSMFPFLDREVRAKAPLAIEELRKEGIWMVNMEFTSITRKGNKVCFHWNHQYTQQKTENPFDKLRAGGKRETGKESLTTCI